MLRVMRCCSVSPAGASPSNTRRFSERRPADEVADRLKVQDAVSHRVVDYAGDGGDLSFDQSARIAEALERLHDAQDGVVLVTGEAHHGKLGDDVMLMVETGSLDIGADVGIQRRGGLRCGCCVWSGVTCATSAITGWPERT